MPPRRLDDTVHFEAEERRIVADTAIEISTDGRRTHTQLSNVRPQKKRARALQPSDLVDDLADWTPVEEDDASTEALADTISSLELGEEDEGSSKRKRYETSDDPMGTWRPHSQAFLDRIMRRHHIGSNPQCEPCGSPRRDDERLFRCVECGEYLQCETCLRDRHQLNPLHRVKEWNGSHWEDAQLCSSAETAARTAAERREGKLPGVRLVYQLGHHGFPCSKPSSVRCMVVLDIHGIFTLDVRYCACRPWNSTSNVNQLIDNAWYPATVTDPATCATLRALEHFRLLNVVGNVSVHDYIGTLERMTNPIILGGVPDRYKEFGRMTRQYNYLQQAARAGWAQMDDGLRLVKPGGMAVLCWTCPHRGMNLPDGWEKVHARYRFLYMLLVALDANFRLKNRLRANERHNPALGAGQAYFVDADPYKEHLRTYVAEKDVSSCIAFAALLQKDTRVTTGLRVSGVGGCVCARHGVVRPLGMGDLQKGERYSNMDYILLSALTGVAVLFVAISYDIACQWKVNLAARAERIAKTTPVSTELKNFDIQYVLPVWHAAAHEASCQMENSLSFAKGVGRTDGEGIERTWSVLNPVGYATKEMGEGARQDAIENKVDHLNFEKNVKEGDLLSRKLIIAIGERNKQVENFTEVDSTLDKDLRKGWLKQIRDWERDHSQPNPYMLRIASGGVTEARALRELKDEDAAEAAEGRTPTSATQTTAPAFIKAGLQLEDTQRRIRSEVKGVTLVTAERSDQIQELRRALLIKLRAFESLQETFMPCVTLLWRAAEERRDPNVAPPKAEDMKLWLPSELSVDQRRSGCRPGLASMEARLREGQCADALQDLRARLHTQRFLITWRNANVVGQRGSTRSATLIGRVGDRIARVASKYRQARSALIALKGEDHAPQYKELRHEDMSVGVEEESDAASRKKLALHGAKKSRNETLKKGFSWIWTVGGGPQEDDNEALHDSVRVEWSKARVRQDRWVEEVELLREEMRRTLRMLRFVQEKWGHELNLRTEASGEVRAGVSVHRRIAEAFHAGWSRHVTTLLPTTTGEIYHVDIEKLTILDEGDGEPWTPEVPAGEVAGPSTPTAVIRPRVEVDDAFDDLSPSKKARAE
ncbi:hypothetical protein FB45DRAFT_1076655 [Roridomyces roridus]|uniref:CxC2-like cysteine cluster KDZ transposase-associated domain-containing protein n=1 Tax=Roridomyces roridus TaxID=1738132 RepID=A0AAD7G210_9AGAR|nr:hypothetical protein FB45DRAFT_1076655 [Roridomyces roridus]